MSRFHQTFTISSDDLIGGTYFPPLSFMARGVRLVSAYVPVTWYTVNDNTNRLTFQYDHIDSAPTTKTITLTNGNYDMTSMCSTLFSLINAQVADLVQTVSISPTTGKMTIQCTGTRAIRIMPSPLAEIIGFSSSTASTFETALTAGSVVQLDMPDTAVHIRSRSLGMEIQGNYHSSLGIRNGIISSVFIDALFGGVTLYNNPSEEYYTLNRGEPVSIDVFDIQFVDKKYREIDFNGANWVITLAFI